MLQETAIGSDSLHKKANTRVAIGATYEGRDPGLLERMLPFVDCIEVTLETIAEVNGSGISLSPEIMTELKNIGKAAQIIVHGVGLSIGSHEGWSPTYLQLLDDFLEQVDVAWHSEHLGYTKVDGEHLGIMLAMPKTEEALDMVCERVSVIHQRYGMPFLLENIVHVLPDSPRRIFRRRVPQFADKTNRLRPHSGRVQPRMRCAQSWVRYPGIFTRTGSFEYSRTACGAGRGTQWISTRCPLAVNAQLNHRDCATGHRPV